MQPMRNRTVLWVNSRLLYWTYLRCCFSAKGLQLSKVWLLLPLNIILFPFFGMAWTSVTWCILGVVQRGGNYSRLNTNMTILSSTWSIEQSPQTLISFSLSFFQVRFFSGSSATSDYPGPPWASMSIIDSISWNRIIMNLFYVFHPSLKNVSTSYK